MKRKRKQPLDNAYIDAQIRAGKNLKGDDLKKCLCALAVWMRNHEEEE